MMITRRHWQTAVGILMVLFLATACYNNIGDNADAPQVSLQITSTPTEEPSLTPTPTEEPVEETEEFEASGAEDLVVAEESTATPTATNTSTPTSTPTETQISPLEVAQAGAGDGTGEDDSGFGQLQQEDEPDPFELTATQLIANATMQFLAPTLTADALTQASQNIFTETPTPTEDLFTGLMTPTQSGPILTGSDCVHEVRRGETMYRYSVTYGLPVNDIATYNGITNPSLIIEGDRITIPNCGTTGAFPPATSTPVVTQSFGSGGPNLDNSASTGQAGGGACVAQYTVQQYDTLFQISLNYGVPVLSIANANGISDINRINMGEVLCIPAS